jgi:hypothetical protein
VPQFPAARQDQQRPGGEDDRRGCDQREAQRVLRPTARKSVTEPVDHIKERLKCDSACQNGGSEWIE